MQVERKPFLIVDKITGKIMKVSNATEYKYIGYVLPLVDLVFWDRTEVDVLEFTESITNFYFRDLSIKIIKENE